MLLYFHVQGVFKQFLASDTERHPGAASLRLHVELITSTIWRNLFNRPARLAIGVGRSGWKGRDALCNDTYMRSVDDTAKFKQTTNYFGAHQTHTCMGRLGSGRGVGGVGDT